MYGTEGQVLFPGTAFLNFGFIIMKITRKINQWVEENKMPFSQCKALFY